MKQKKLIGTIIGVLLFIILIAGATFAWLTYSVNVTNGTYNASTGNFVIDYVGGGEITDVPILETGTPENASVKQITAKLSTGSISGKLTIKLTTSSDNLLTTSGAIKYAICTSTTTTSPCTNDFTSAVITGTVRTTGEMVLYSDNEELTTNNKYYFVYFWVDVASLNNNILTDGQNSYSGYIHARAEQSH